MSYIKQHLLETSAIIQKIDFNVVEKWLIFLEKQENKRKTFYSWGRWKLQMPLMWLMTLEKYVE